MPDIRLQDYTSKIRDLIENGRHDEAIAHGQQILHHYPMHVETYSQLGEAFLEKGFPQEATELFQRALSADPENLTSRAGLGMIYDKQGMLPDATWQMERAFALGPGNLEVRRELSRMYAERDGTPEARIKLTRDALGRLYARNGLYERAITEFRAVLRKDPDLPDMRVALVESLWREGRRLEAVETCLSLLEALPNCLKANLILGEIWLRAGHTDMAEEKLSTARALDPENLVAQGMMGGDSPLPPEEVYLPELEISDEELGRLVARLAPAAAVTLAREAPAVTGPEGAPSTSEIPDWLEEQEGVEGAVVEEPQPLDGTPDWLRDPPTETSVPVAGTAMAETAASQDEMPEWLREPAPPEMVKDRKPEPAVKAETSEQRAKLQRQLEAEPDNNQARLELARLSRSDRDMDASLDHYEVLISDPELRPQVIDDLASLAAEDVDQTQVFQLLGDAHMQDDQLDEALEMYRQAHQALRKA
jgi:tetratricopeptide (TPR) repeat protein